MQLPIVLKGGYFPAFFAVVLKFGVREGFALDWLLRHSVVVWNAYPQAVGVPVL
jgi:hypothetical protein